MVFHSHIKRMPGYENVKKDIGLKIFITKEVYFCILFETMTFCADLQNLQLHMRDHFQNKHFHSDLGRGPFIYYVIVANSKLGGDMSPCPHTHRRGQKQIFTCPPNYIHVVIERPYISLNLSPWALSHDMHHSDKKYPSLGVLGFA